MGTKAHGHGSNNRLTIPESWRELKRFYERMTDYVVVKRQVGERELPFLVEPTRPDWFYPCTIEDACTVLSHLPKEDLYAFDLIVMRQPTRKQIVLSSAWGRAAFCFEVDEYSGNAIILEAQTLASLSWTVSLTPEEVRELDRLREDGHEIRKTKRGFEIRPTKVNLRNTVLYRTLLHEVGHHVDARRCSRDEWDSKTTSSKEDFAHRYAAERMAWLRQLSVAPFDSILDEEEMHETNLKLEWFCSP